MTERSAQRIRKTEFLGGIYEGYQSLDQLIDSLVRIQKQAKATRISDVVVSIGCGDISIEGKRFETDAEYEHRQRREALAAETAQRARKAQYEELKKEFGNEH